jgi:hypothetical protein
MRKDMEIFEIWFEETMVPAAKSDEGQPMYAYNLKRIKEIMRKAWKGAWFLKESEVGKFKEENEKLLSERDLEKHEREKLKEVSEKVITILFQSVEFYAKNNCDLMEQNQYGKKVPLGSNALKALDKITRYKDFMAINGEEVVTHEVVAEKGLQDILETMLDNSDPEHSDISKVIESKLAKKELKEILAEEDEELSAKEKAFQKEATNLLSDDPQKVKKKFSVGKF